MVILGVDEIKKDVERADQDGLDMWCGWEKRECLNYCHTQKWRENDQEEGPERDGQTIERIYK